MTLYDAILKQDFKARWRRLLFGVLLGCGAPIGWLTIRLFQGVRLRAELVVHWDLYLYLTVGGITVFGIFGYALGRQEDYLRKLGQKLSVASITDDLTGLRNSRYFWERLNEEFAAASRNDQPLSLVLLDIDHFKRVNDMWGHERGNQVLRNIGIILQEEVRRYDIATRIGGEEFGLLLPGTDLETAIYVANRVRQKIHETEYPGQDEEAFQITISGGAAMRRGEVDEPKELFQRADQALYRAKENGRDRIEPYRMPDDKDEDSRKNLVS